MTRRRAGFTLIEVLVATALLGFALIVMFGFHAQALRSNMQARRMTDCTYLAQQEMEQLQSLPWTESYTHPDLEDLGDDPTSASDPWAFLEHPAGTGTAPTPTNGADSTDTTYGPALYYVTWDIQTMDDLDPTSETWARLRVRCTWYDKAFNVWQGTTISDYRFRD